MNKEKDFRRFFLDMSEVDRAKYAAEAGTTAGYIQTHLITRYCIPRKKLLQGLADASKGAFKLTDLTSFFYSEKDAA
jgi:hypothetical protein